MPGSVTRGRVVDGGDQSARARRRVVRGLDDRARLVVERDVQRGHAVRARARIIRALGLFQVGLAAQIRDAGVRDASVFVLRGRLAGTGGYPVGHIAHVPVNLRASRGLVGVEPEGEIPWQHFSDTYDNEHTCAVVAAFHTQLNGLLR